jgi:hypothetical protein
LFAGYGDSVVMAYDITPITIEDIGLGDSGCGGTRPGHAHDPML